MNINIKSKIENFWYHYKWVTIISAFFIFLFIFGIVQFATKPKYDYTVVLATDTYFPPATQVQDIKACLDKIAPDANGDGKVDVGVAVVYTGKDSTQNPSTMQSKLVAEMSMGENMVFIVDDTIYNKYKYSGFFDELDGYEPLDNDVICTRYCWKDTALYNMLNKSDALFGYPDNLYYCIRRVKGTDLENDSAKVEKWNSAKQLITRLIGEKQ